MKKYYDCGEDFDSRRFTQTDIESTECLKCCNGHRRNDGYYNGNGYDGYDNGYNGYDNDNGDDCCCKGYGGCCQRKFKCSLRHLIGVTVRLFISNETVITGIILCVAGDEVKVLERNSDRVIVIRDKDIVYVEEPRFFPQF